VVRTQWRTSVSRTKEQESQEFKKTRLKKLTLEATDYIDFQSLFMLVIILGQVNQRRVGLLDCFECFVIVVNKALK
jgi:hypothetical protein